ncbi:U11/U12 small nuclear ribonucleoprotein 25 kDa protein-like [Clytia hemisphaerica]|uniref:U11/U12 small nuclear ribonucleoprotein 25 kDa protein-like n=1 Tax=Clytia hemisphaerica TaxID=252671 RepID=UPI0034D72B3B
MESLPNKKSISHREMLDITQKQIEEILKDPLLSDIPNLVTPEELKAKIDLEKGNAFVIFLKRETEEGHQNIDIIVNDRTTILEMKKLIERKMTRIIEIEDGPKCLSWKYFWKTFWLVHNNEKLKDDKKTLKDYNIKNNSELIFLKRLRRE